MLDHDSGVSTPRPRSQGIEVNERVRVIAILTVFIALLIGWILWAGKGFHSSRTFRGEILETGEAAEGEPRRDTAASQPPTLRIMTWNIGYGFGIGSEGVRYQPKSREHFTNSLERMAEVIRENKADIVLLQEVDFDSKRTFYVDQLRELSRATGLRHAARAVSWDANHIPYPYWPIEKQFGRMSSGGGVLSRFPILANEVTLHQKPPHFFIYRYFYPYRYSQAVRIRIGDRDHWVVNNHFEAFNKQNRTIQAQALYELLEKYEDEPLLGFGGDLNTTPPEAVKKHGFSDDERDDYREDPTLGILSALKGFREIVTSDEYRADERVYFTFPTDVPTRRLDYLFLRNEFSLKTKEVVRTGVLSDHFPMIAEIAI